MVEAKIRKWGNSMGIVLPKEFVNERNLKEGDTVNVEVIKRADLRKLFGTVKFKQSAQEIKDELRKGWD